MNNNPLRYQKRVLQFGNLPFLYGETTSQNLTNGFKGSTQVYTNNAHGGYYPNLSDSGKLDVSELEVRLAISLKEVDCSDRARYSAFIKRQLAQPAKLWAVQNGTQLIWTRARAVTVGEVVDTQTLTDYVIFDVTFELIDGYWVIAKRTRTFLCEYCPSRFVDFMPGYCVTEEELDGNCDETGTSKCFPCLGKLLKPPVYVGCQGEALCKYSAEQLAQMFSAPCPNSYFINYSCELEAQRFCKDATYGTKHSLSAGQQDNTTTIMHCCRSDLPTSFVRVRLNGDFVNPSVTINGDTVQIGSMLNTKNLTGFTTIGFNESQIYNSLSNQDADDDIMDLLSASSRTNTPMFELKPGTNEIIVTGNVYNKSAYVYIESVDITY